MKNWVPVGFDDNEVVEFLVVDANHSLLYQRIDPLAGDAAWLAVLVERSVAEQKRYRLQSSGQALSVVTACLSEDHRYSWELTDLAQELAQRNEELNLFYSLDDLSGNDHGIELGLEPLLEKIVMYAGVDLAGSHKHTDATAAVQARAHIGDTGLESTLNYGRHVLFLFHTRHLPARAPIRVP